MFKKTVSALVLVIASQVLHAENAPNDQEALIREFAEIHKKYADVRAAVYSLMQEPEFLCELELLNEKHRMKEYSEAYAALIAKSIPEYAAYQEEIRRVGEK